MLLDKSLEYFEKLLVAHYVPQHVHHRGALGAGQGPQFRRKILQPRRLDDGHVVDGQRLHHHVVKLRFHGRRPAAVLGPQHLGISRGAVRQPQVIAGRGGNGLFPPLARNLISEELAVDLPSKAARCQENQPGRRIAVRSAGIGFDHCQIGIRRQSQHARKVRHDLTGLLPVRLRHVGFRAAEIQSSGHSFGLHFDGLALHHRDASRERRLFELHVIYVLIAGRLERIESSRQQ